jgi:hypothetical protein
MIGEDSTVGVPDHPPDAPRIPIIKLHGSVNWFQEQNSTKWQALNVMAGTGNRYDDLEINDNITPAIIPPMLGKASIAPIISAQWKAAMKVLSRARQIVIIGCSFPVTDAFMLRLLSKGLKSNMDSDRILIIDKNPFNKWKPLLRSIFNPVG